MGWGFIMRMAWLPPGTAPAPAGLESWRTGLCTLGQSGGRVCRKQGQTFLQLQSSRNGAVAGIEADES